MYMLDTNICIYTMKHHPPEVRERLLAIPLKNVAISGIVLAELQYGIEKSQKKQENQLALDDFLNFCQVFDWPQAASKNYAHLRAKLEQKGQIIGANDLLIAAHALYLNATLVTNNINEFKRVTGLKLENWVH